MTTTAMTAPHPWSLALVLCAVVVCAGCNAGTSESGARSGGAADGSHGPRFRVEDFARSGVQLATAGAGIVDAGVDLPGEVRPNGERTAHLAPRFSGVVREVRKGVGESVRAGEVLAVVESDTLAPFELRAPFDGVIVDRHVVAGETVSRESPAFIVADLTTVWIDAHVYQNALAAVGVGQAVRVVAAQGPARADGAVAYVAPVVDQATRTASARIVLPNPDGAWRPGLFVTVTVLNPVEAGVAVPRTAIHRLHDATVLFVVEADTLVPRPVTVGRTGRTTAEITAGIVPGEQFAAEGSFLVKAELGKGAAGHGE